MIREYLLNNQKNTTDLIIIIHSGKGNHVTKTVKLFVRNEEIVKWEYVGCPEKDSDDELFGWLLVG